MEWDRGLLRDCRQQDAGSLHDWGCAIKANWGDSMSVSRSVILITTGGFLCLLSGCASLDLSGAAALVVVESNSDAPADSSQTLRNEIQPSGAIQLASYEAVETADEEIPPPPATPAVSPPSQKPVAAAQPPEPVPTTVAPAQGPASIPDLDKLLREALKKNRELRKLRNEYQAAAARSRSLGYLPDPRIGTTIFGAPIETAAGSQQAQIAISQALPWFGRLDAEEKQACFEALVVQSEYVAEGLRVLEDIRKAWSRIYVVDRQIEITNANQSLLTTLIDVASTRLAAGEGSPGDVQLATLELAKLEERLLLYRQQRKSIQAELNRLVGNPPATTVVPSAWLPVQFIDLDADAIFEITKESQPTLKTARLRTQATRWGIEVARLQKRPELMLSASYFVTDSNRPASPLLDAGQDPWAIGLQVSLPIGKDKYDAIRDTAAWKHQSAHADEDDLLAKYEAMIPQLVYEADRARATFELYTTTILPQARQTLEVDQESYANGGVEFDRVVQDYRNLLTLELGRYQAIGDLAVANARIQRAAGRDLPEMTKTIPLAGGYEDPEQPEVR